MRPVLEDVQLGRDLRLTQREIEADAVLGDHTGVGVGVEEERRWRLRRDLQLVGQELHERRVGRVANQSAYRAEVRDRLYQLREALFGVALPADT